MLIAIDSTVYCSGVDKSFVFDVKAYALYSNRYHNMSINSRNMQTNKTQIKQTKYFD